MYFVGDAGVCEDASGEKWGVYGEVLGEAGQGLERSGGGKEELDCLGAEGYAGERGLVGTGNRVGRMTSDFVFREGRVEGRGCRVLWVCGYEFDDGVYAPFFVIVDVHILPCRC